VQSRFLGPVISFLLAVFFGAASCIAAASDSAQQAQPTVTVTKTATAEPADEPVPIDWQEATQNEALQPSAMWVDVMNKQQCDKISGLSDPNDAQAQPIYEGLMQACLAVQANGPATAWTSAANMLKRAKQMYVPPAALDCAGQFALDRFESIMKTHQENPEKRLQFRVVPAGKSPPICP
jgi:hypothetical protein